MTLAAATLVVGAAAAIFGLLAWLTGRQRQSFTLHRDGNLVRLTRARRPAVQLRRVFVFGRGDLGAADRAGTTEWRTLRRDQSLILDLRQWTPDGGSHRSQAWVWVSAMGSANVPTIRVTNVLYCAPHIAPHALPTPCGERFIPLELRIRHAPHAPHAVCR